MLPLLYRAAVKWLPCVGQVSLVALGIVDLGDTLNTWDAERKVLGFTLACWITTALELVREGEREPEHTEL